MQASICTACKRREAVYFRPYSGERLCKKCFIESIEEKTRATISKYEMFEFDDRIAVGVSGGKDSTSLLYVLEKIEREFPKSTLVAVTVDEGIKGYRDEALKIARKNCEKLGVEHHVVSFKKLFGYKLDEIVELMKKREAELSPCAYCGVLRRRALNIAAREVDADKLATAHSLDDEVQSILINILHGDPLRLARAKPVTEEVHEKLVRRVKPFCEIPEREIAFYAYLKNIEFQSFPCPYAPQALRSEIRIILNRLEERHPGMKYTIFRSIERIRPALERMAEKELKECRICGEPTTGEICKVCELLQELGI